LTVIKIGKDYFQAEEGAKQAPTVDFSSDSQ